MIKSSEVPLSYRRLNLHQQTLRVLKARGWHNPREHHHGALTPDEKGLTGDINASVAFSSETADEIAALFAGLKSGMLYARLAGGTPPIPPLTKKMLDLELGKDHPNRSDYNVLFTSTGMGSIVALTMALVPFCGEFISSPYLYGGTYQWFKDFLPKIGRQCFFVNDPRDLDEWESLLKCRPMASLLYWEEDPNPTPFKLDGAGIAKLAKKYGKPSVSDNTIPTPALNQPLLYGVDAVIESTSKNIGGKSKGLGGSTTGKNEIIEKIRAWSGVLGNVMDARVADYMFWGARTLKARMAQKVKNSAAIADFLQKDKRVKKVYWSGSDLISFELHGTLEQAKKVVESFKFILMAPHLGDDYPLGIHPASATHSKVPAEERLKLGISDTLIRLSPGLPHHSDVKGDILLALDRVYGKI